jgi:hypothetical protein
MVRLEYQWNAPALEPLYGIFLGKDLQRSLHDALSAGVSL